MATDKFNYSGETGSPQKSNDRKDSHPHRHGIVDPAIISTELGMKAVKLSLAGLLATALLQSIVVYFSGSVALFADTLHNFGDAATAVPLWIAFKLARRKPTRRFPYGFGRVEDLAGVAIVVIILFSAIFAGYKSIDRIYHPREVTHLWVVVAASLIGFLGNEAVARFRIKAGEKMGSAALIADGQHARVDGLTSLAVLFGAIGIMLGYPLADPIIGLLITAAIFKIVWDSGKSVFTRLLDGINPEIIDEIEHTLGHVARIRDTGEVRVRWVGHRLYAEINIAVDPELSIKEAHKVAKKARHQLLHHLDYLSHVVIHVDPVGVSGERHHQVDSHTHDQLPPHSH